jgi:peptidoglycan/LPS O-acetylase OafA/YrhL
MPGPNRLTATPVQHHRFHLLDALRGIAAILVIFRHAPVEFRHALTFDNSFLAVDFFFCLSGFVIAFSYEKRLQDFLRFKDFFVARVIRLYPLAALGTMAGAIGLLVTRYFHLSGPSSSLPSIARELAVGLLMLPDLLTKQRNSPLFPLDAVLWTLFFEIIANFVYAGLVRFKAAQTKILLAIAAVSFVLLCAQGWRSGRLDKGFLIVNSPVGLIRVGVSFFLGVLIYRLFHHLGRRYLSGGKSLPAAIAVSGGLVFLMCFNWPQRHMVAIQLAIICAVFPLLVLAGAHVRLSERWTPICSFLGDISYPLYLLHPVLFWILEKDRARAYAVAHPSIATWIMLGYALFAVAICWIVGRFYDAPVRRRLTDAYRSSS